MGIGQALSEGTQLDGEGRHRNAHLTDYKLVTASDAPQIDIAWIETETPNAGPKGSKGVGEPPCVPTAGAIANAIAKVTGARVHELPMTPERVWEARAMSVHLLHRPPHVARRRARGARRRGAPGRRRHRPRRRRPLRQGAAAGEHRRDPSRRRAARVESLDDGSLRLGALASHAEIAAQRGRPSPLHRPRRRLRDRRLARDARAGDDRRQPDERLAGDGDGRPARLLRRDRDAPVAAPAPREVAVEDLWTGPGGTVAREDELLVAVARAGPGRRARAAPTSGSSTGGRWRSRSSARRPSSRSTAAPSRTPGSR